MKQNLYPILNNVNIAEILHTQTNGFHSLATNERSFSILLYVKYMVDTYTGM